LADVLRPTFETLRFLTLTRGAAAQNKPLSGSYGWLANVYQLDTGNGSGLSVLGIINFDGTGNLTGTYTGQSRGVDGGPARNGSGMLTGVYSINPDGTGLFTATLDIGLTLPIAFVLSEGGQALQLLSPTNLGDGGNISLQGTAQSLAGALPMPTLPAPRVFSKACSAGVALPSTQTVNLAGSQP